MAYNIFENLSYKTSDNLTSANLGYSGEQGIYERICMFTI